LKDYNHLPVEGGMMDQSIRFLRCVEWCDLINLKMKNEATKQEKITQGFAKKFNKIFKKKK